MNREIKFRAWDKKAFCMMEVVTIDFDQQSVSIRDHEAFYYESLVNVELMQYTGLKDKNGVEIYEGDILFEDDQSIRAQGKKRRYSIVVFRDCGWKRDTYNGSMNVFPDITVRPMEVIGNIYENPELLETK